jgi:hypothetical protein
MYIVGRMMDGRSRVPRPTGKSDIIMAAYSVCRPTSYLSLYFLNAYTTYYAAAEEHHATELPRYTHGYNTHELCTHNIYIYICIGIVIVLRNGL